MAASSTTHLYMPILGPQPDLIILRPFTRLCSTIFGKSAQVTECVHTLAINVLFQTILKSCKCKQAYSVLKLIPPGPSLRPNTLTISSYLGQPSDQSWPPHSHLGFGPALRVQYPRALEGPSPGLRSQPHDPLLCKLGGIVCHWWKSVNVSILFKNQERCTETNLCRF